MSLLHDRLEAVTKGRTYRALGDATGTHPETVRRYMQGQAPSVEFITALCGALEINPEWMLTGQGPMHVRDVRPHALREANAAELLGAVASTLEALRERMDRVEVYVQTMESRLRGEMQAALSGDQKKTRLGDGADDGKTTKASKRARRVADAIGERARSDVD